MDRFDSEEVPPDFLDAFCTIALASLRRSAQRRWGELYVRGLLSVEGRKTMRGIASVTGPRAQSVEQGLQQFISRSPWDWRPVRRSLARHLDREVHPSAWVIEPLVIQKVGQHSVGVGQQFVPRLGRLANCQQTIGVWLATEQAGFPVDWRLVLPPSWIDNCERRERAAIPDQERPLTTHQCAIDAVAEMAGAWNITPRPVVMDGRDAHPRQLICELSSRGVPFLLRVGAAVPVCPVDPRTGTGELTSTRQLIESLSGQGKPVEWRDHLSSVRLRGLVVGTQVHSPLWAGRPVGDDHLVLMGTWEGAGRRSTSYWLSNISQLPLATLFRFSKLTDRVLRDMTEVADRMGVRDFEGRSYRGWHHHITLVSVAHAAWMLGAGRRSPARDDPRLSAAAPTSAPTPEPATPEPATRPVPGPSPAMASG